MYFAALSECFLIAVLIWLVVSVRHLNKISRLSVSAALLFIALTAAIGAIKYLGFNDVASVHELTALVSKGIAMIIVPIAFAVIVSATVSTIIISSVLMISSITGMILAVDILMDGALLLALVLLITKLAAKHKNAAKSVLLGTLLLLPLPLLPLLSLSADAEMALFHVLLGLYFLGLGMGCKILVNER